MSVARYLQLPTCTECGRTIWTPAFVIHGYRGVRRHIRHLLAPQRRTR